MRIDLEKVLLQGGRIDATIPMGELEWERGQEIPVGPVELKGTLARVRRGFELDATIDGAVTLACVRCLVSFEYPLAFPFHLTFVSAERLEPGESQMQPGDCDLYAHTEGKVDLAAIAREQIYLQLPLKPVCSESCRGLCLTCGEDIGRGACRCDAQSNVRVD
jgi:DUF177 domain-containing protein